MLSEDQNVIFLHIPKTAGTSFRKILERMYTPPQILVADAARKGISTLRSKPVAERAEIKLINGHVTFGIHEYLVGATTYLTFLRDPVERVISYYYYVRRVPHHEIHERVSKMDFHEFVTTIGRWDVHNTQITMINGKPEAPKVMLQKAVEHVEQHFSFVGLVERFEDSLLLFKDQFQLTNQQVRHKVLNKTSKRPTAADLDSKTLTAIQELNAEDYEFYHLMKARFEQQFADIEYRKLKALSLALSNTTYDFMVRAKKRYKRLRNGK